MKWCSDCRTTFDPDVKFCGICGQELITRTITSPLVDIAQPEGGSSYLGQTIDKRYLIKKLVGRGGMGTVYEVEHTLMKRRLAMKLLHEDMVVRKQLVSRFTREARAVSRLNSPHTVTVHDFGRYEALFFLVMEYLDGEDLEVVLSREGALPWQRAFKILAQVCESLEEAHEAGIVHRDLKPENIMVLFEPEGADFIKVLDFGLAKISGGEDLFSVHSHRDLFGTPFYMSPEQIRSEDIDHRADIYSLGCLAFRCLTNQHVYDAPYAFDVLRQHLTSPIPSPRRTMPRAGIPERVDRLVLTALSKRRENRFADVTAMRREILDCLENPEGSSLVIPASVEAEMPDAIDDALRARLQAFEQSHQLAEARLQGDSSDSLPYGEVIYDDDEGEFMPEPRAVDVTPPLIDLSPPPDSSEHPMNVVTTEISLDSRRSNTAVRMVPVNSRAAIQSDDDPDGELLDPSEEGQLFRRIRRRRRMRMALLASFLVASTGAAWWYFDRGIPIDRGIELEPNDTVDSANELAADLVVRGTLGKRISQFQGDKDAFKVPMGGAGQLLSLNVGPLDGVDLSVEVLESNGRQIARINHSGIGQPETIHNVLVTSEEAIVIVSEYNDGKSKPVEGTESYRLSASRSGQPNESIEIEPNDSWITANRYIPGKKVSGVIDGPGDTDSYRITVDPNEKRQRWEFVIESKNRVVPRIELHRIIDETEVLVFSDEGRHGLLRTVYEEQSPHDVFSVRVSHAGRGADRGAYSFLADLTKRKQRIAHEPNDDRVRSTAVEIGERVHGALEDKSDQDVFAIPVTDPRYRAIEVEMDPVTRSRLRVVISDVSRGHIKEFPRRVLQDAPPQPGSSDGRPMRFAGLGETYYLSIRHRTTAGRKNVGYSFTIRRLLTGTIGAPVGGPPGF